MFWHADPIGRLTILDHDTYAISGVIHKTFIGALSTHIVKNTRPILPPLDAKPRPIQLVPCGARQTYRKMPVIAS